MYQGKDTIPVHSVSPAYKLRHFGRLLLRPCMGSQPKHTGRSCWRETPASKLEQYIPPQAHMRIPVSANNNHRAHKNVTLTSRSQARTLFLLTEENGPTSTRNCSDSIELSYLIFRSIATNASYVCKETQISPYWSAFLMSVILKWMHIRRV